MLFVLLGQVLTFTSCRSTGDPSQSENPGTLYTDIAHAPTLSLRDLETEIHRVVNSVRIEHGVAPLAWHDTLAAIARDHSNDMLDRDFFDHTNPDGENPTARAQRNGYHCLKQLEVNLYAKGIAENLMSLYRYDSYFTIEEEGGPRYLYRWRDEKQIAGDVVESWLGSPDHRENLLNAQYDREGIGIAVTVTQRILVRQNLC